MERKRVGAYALVAVTALGFGFFFATQVRAQLIPTSNRVARNQALVRSAQELEAKNSAYRQRIADLRDQISKLETQASQQSDAVRQMQDEVNDLRAHAGLVSLRGPGVRVDLADGTPGPGAGVGGQPGYLVNFQDLQDVVNVLYAGGAEGVAINGRRISPLTGFRSSGGNIVIDQGPPLQSPYQIVAVGDRSGMERLLADPSSLGDLRARERQFELRVTWSGAPDLLVPAYDASLEASDVRPA
jgi:uncharacterized protein YlxW (UPF0749 family)